MPFGVGVTHPNGEPKLLTEGPLEAAIAASCAVPWLFAPVQVQSITYRDGGVTDRTALTAWRTYRPQARVALHLVDRSAGAESPDELSDLLVVRSPRSGASLWSLGDVAARYDHTRRRALRAFIDAGV